MLRKMCAVAIGISIHAPREGSDDLIDEYAAFRAEFQSTLPARGATLERRTIELILAISIHAPREGSDEYAAAGTAFPCISIHAPREGSDMIPSQPVFHTVEFQSTFPARGATGFVGVGSAYASNFNPRSPRGERLFFSVRRVPLDHISIHAPREGSDISHGLLWGYPLYFNPRSPRGERPALRG